MTGRFLHLPQPAVSETTAGHLPPAHIPQPAPAALSFPASPHCVNAAFHMSDRYGRKLCCSDCPPPPCPDCRGRGFRIVTDDGTRPACITCEGLGALAGGGAYG